MAPNIITMIKIAVGVGENKNILKAADIFKTENTNVEIELVYDDENLTDAILDKKTNAVIRGSLPASGVIGQLKKKFPNLTRATYIKDDERELLLSPVGIDEGESVDERVKLAVECGNFLEKQGTTPKIAVLASGRKGDMKRSSKVSQSIRQSEELTRMLKSSTDFEVKNYYILIEQAIKDKYNIIIAPNGIIGNIIFRTLVLVNSWPSYGAVSFGIDGIYIDTSRDQNVEGYLRSLKLAYKLANI